jgi:hypothetical protein
MCRSICETEQLGKPAIERRSKPPIWERVVRLLSGIPITVDIYGRLIPGSNRQAVNRLDEQLSSTYPQPRQKERAQLVDIAP